MPPHPTITLHFTSDDRVGTAIDAAAAQWNWPGPIGGLANTRLQMPEPATATAARHQTLSEAGLQKQEGGKEAAVVTVVPGGAAAHWAWRGARS